MLNPKTDGGDEAITDNGHCAFVPAESFPRTLGMRSMRVLVEVTVNVQCDDPRPRLSAREMVENVLHDPEFIVPVSDVHSLILDVTEVVEG